MPLTVPTDQGRAACRDSVNAFLRAVGSVDEYALLAASRCHGWTRLDVVAHVLAGWQEMLAGLVSPVDDQPTVDAASYWPAFAAESADEDRVATLMTQRRRSAVFTRPGSGVAQLQDVGTALLQGVDALPDRPCRWQGHVFGAGDYLAVWAVEVVVHHLDLLTREPPPPSALSLARATVEALVGAPLPRGWTDEDAVLVGAGRSPVPAGLEALAGRLPALG